jgi:starvation-inducible DNA-binding protein
MPPIAISPATPFHTRIDLPATTRGPLVELLNRRLADAVDLQTQCKQAHWNVKGPSFIALHKLFDEVHESVTEYADMLAERIVQLGGVAIGTARAVAARSELAEYPLAATSGEDHVKGLSAALAAFGSRARAAIRDASGLDDDVTVDMCTEIARGVDKLLWFVEAHAPTRV